MPKWERNILYNGTNRCVLECRFVPSRCRPPSVLSGRESQSEREKDVPRRSKPLRKIHFWFVMMQTSVSSRWIH